MRFRLYVVEKKLLAIPREWFGIDNRPVQLCLNNSPPHCGPDAMIVIQSGSKDVVNEATVERSSSTTRTCKRNCHVCNWNIRKLQRDICFYAKLEFVF